jgi:hypothetical protein
MTKHGKYRGEGKTQRESTREYEYYGWGALRVGVGVRIDHNKRRQSDHLVYQLLISKAAFVNTYLNFKQP